MVPKLQTGPGEIWVMQANIPELAGGLCRITWVILFCIHIPTFYAVMFLGLDTLSRARVLSISSLQSCWLDCKVPEDRALVTVFIEHLLYFSGTDYDDTNETSAAGSLTCMKPL